ncbi:MAG: PCP reductase family protein [Proteobacteria bacterium]|nr:PCP reductase family protein [Pseudomonadota bacterium]
MKFLCVSCDEAMKLMEVAPPDRGSLSVVYRCPTCAQEIAMLTNPFETQVVGSLGVQIGADSDPMDGESRCPFSSMVPELGAQGEESSPELRWSPEASSRLANMPEFARPLAKAGIEKFAKERGLGKIDMSVLDGARKSMGM